MKSKYFYNDQKAIRCKCSLENNGIRLHLQVRRWRLFWVNAGAKDVFVRTSNIRLENDFNSFRIKIGDPFINTTTLCGSRHEVYYEGEFYLEKRAETFLREYDMEVAKREAFLKYWSGVLEI